MSTLDTAPGAGDLTIMLREGEPVTLKCSPGAALRLSRITGLYDPDNINADTVFRRVRRCSVDMICEVIRAGVGVGSNADPALGEKVYNYGLLKLSGELSDWIIILANGGRPLVGGDDDAGPLGNP